MARDPDPFFAELTALLPRLRAYARSLVRGDPDRAADLVQDTVARALAQRAKFAPGTDLRAWLFTLMHNQHVNLVRASSRRVTTTTDPVILESLSVEPPQRTSFLVRDLVAALRRLPPEMRSMLLLAADELSYDEMAARTKLPIGTVRSRLSRGRAELRLLLDGTVEPLDEVDLDLVNRWARPHRR